METLPSRQTATQSMRLSWASTQRPPRRKYSGNMVVAWYPSGTTPSLGAGSKDTSGASPRPRAAKSGAWYAGSTKLMFQISPS